MIDHLEKSGGVTWMRAPSEKLFMRAIKTSFVGLLLAGILVIAPTAAFARGGGGGGHGGGGHGGGFGGHGGGHGHFAGFASHGLAAHQGAHFAEHRRHGRHYGYGGAYWGWDGAPYLYGYPYYGYYDYEEGNYSDAQASTSEVAPSEQAIVAVQKELGKLGYYHDPIDGIDGPATRKAISWFQSVAKLSVSGRIDDPTLKALQIS
jgi:Putative peptidoglycan binding domain